MTQLTLFDSSNATAVADAPNRPKPAQATRGKAKPRGARRSPSGNSGTRSATGPKTGANRHPAKNTQDAVRRFSDGPTQIVAQQQDTSVTSSVADGGNQSLPESPDGVQRMGDLARLVLMRYEMVAKRRAIMAEKRRQKSGHA